MDLELLVCTWMCFVSILGFGVLFCLEWGSFWEEARKSSKPMELMRKDLSVTRDVHRLTINWNIYHSIFPLPFRSSYVICKFMISPKISGSYVGFCDETKNEIRP
jgi:hypothetical protein